VSDLFGLVYVWLFCFTFQPWAILYDIPVLIVVLRLNTFVYQMPALIEQVRMLVNYKVVVFLGTTSLWLWFWATIGVYCFSRCDDLRSEFRGIGTAIQLIIQIMTFDSWNAILVQWDNVATDPNTGAALGVIETCEDVDMNCLPWMAYGWVYMVVLTFGILLMNLLIALITERVAQNSQEQEAARHSLLPAPSFTGLQPPNVPPDDYHVRNEELKLEMRLLRQEISRLAARLDSANTSSAEPHLEPLDSA